MAPASDGKVTKQSCSIFPLISFINHDEATNVSIVQQEGYAMIIATRNIHKGEQLFLDYANGSPLNSHNRKMLYFKFGFLPPDEMEELHKKYGYREEEKELDEELLLMNY